MNRIIVKSGCANGASKMGGIIARAPGDIAGRLWTLYWLARMTRAATQSSVFVELGTRQGDSARALLAACQDIQGGLYSYDIEDCSGNVQDADLRLSWTFTKKDSITAGNDWRFPLWNKTQMPTLALCFIDTDHTLATTRAEIAAWHRHVRVGGCLVFHDYWLNREPEGQGVKIAVDEFFGQHPEDWMLECHDAYNDTGLGILWRTK